MTLSSNEEAKALCYAIEAYFKVPVRVSFPIDDNSFIYEVDSIHSKPMMTQRFEVTVKLLSNVEMIKT